MCIGEDVQCFGANDGMAQAIPMQGTAPYSYSWSNGAFTQTVSSLAPGMYAVTITDANGCQAFCGVTISEPPLLVPSCSLQSEVSCAGASDGAAIVMASGGTPPYSYSWNNGANT